MGKLFTYLSILIFVDLLFLFTIGVNTEATLTSALVNFTNNPVVQKANADGTFSTGLNLSGLFLSFLLNIGIVGVGVSLAFLTKSEVFVWIGLATGLLYNLVVDYGYIYIRLYNIAPPFSKIFASFLLIPIIILFLFTLVEWLRLKD